MAWNSSPEDLPTTSSPTGPVRRVLVVARHRLVRDAVCTAVVAMGLEPSQLDEPDNHIDLNSFRRQIAHIKPDVGLLIADLHDAGRLWSLLNISSRTDVSWVMLSNTVNPPVRHALIASGARKVLPAQTSLAQLHRELVAAASKQMRCVRHLPVTETDREDELLAIRLTRLSARELAVLEQLAEGRSVHVIAQREGVAEGTVRSQVKAVRSKLEVRSQLQAVANYRRVNAWFEPQERD